MISKPIILLPYTQFSTDTTQKNKPIPYESPPATSAKPLTERTVEVEDGTSSISYLLLLKYGLYTATTALAGATLLLNCYCLSAGMPPPPFINCFALTGIGIGGWAILKYNSLPDYDNKKELAGYRIEGKTLTLDQAIDKHGRYIFEKQLIPPDEFEKKFIQESQQIISIPVFLDRHLQMQVITKIYGNNQYKVPNPALLQEKFQKETRDLSLEEIDQRGNLEFLFSLQLVSPEEFLIKYSQHQQYLLKTKGLTAVISYYNYIKEKIQLQPVNVSYEIPPPKFFHKEWIASLSSMDLKQFLSGSKLEDIIFYKMIEDPDHIRQVKEIFTQFPDAVDLQKREQQWNQTKKNLLTR
jgi:hypothetical protein